MKNYYLDMLYLKTATLIEAAAKASATLVGKDPHKHALYGKNLGLSFQIIDDILDITASSEVLGKPALNDFVEGKCTLPYIYLYEALLEDEKEQLVGLHAKELTKEQSQWIQEKMKKHKSVERSFSLAKELSDEAKRAMSDDVELVAILDAMIQRSY